MTADKVLVSACLLGERVRWDGGSSSSGSGILTRWLEEGRVVPICPEVAGGLPVPRPPAEIQGLRVVDVSGEDRSTEFARGAEAAVELARDHSIRVAVLKENSPSCGSGSIYDGTFKHTLVAGEGWTAAALRRAGVAVFNELSLAEADTLLRRGG